MTVSSVTNRLGLDPFGTDVPIIGNVLLYPRRILLEVFQRAFQYENLFTPETASGIPQEVNPFLLKYAADGSLAPDSRLVLADFGSDDLIKKEARPRLIVERSGGRFINQGMGDKNDISWGGVQHSRKSNLYQSMINIRAVGRKKIESELLALSAQMLIQMFKDEIKKKSALHYIGTPEVGPTVPEKADAEVEQYSTSVTIEIAQAINWNKSPLNITVVNEICIAISAS